MATVTQTPIIDEINAMDYQNMLAIWRNTPIGSNSPYFTGETGEHFKKQMLAKKAALSPSQRVAISKNIGW